MISAETIHELKKEHGKIYKAVIAGVEYIYRRISRTEYLDLSKKVQTDENFDQELAVVKLCILNESGKENIELASGAVTVLYEQVLLKSGFEQVESEEL